MVRIAGTVCLLMLFAGLLFADDLMKLDDQGGVTRFKVDPNGNVGIGTTNPLELFHVSGGHFLMDNQKAIKYKDSVGTAYPAFQLYNDEMYIDNQAAGSINFRTNPTKGSASVRMYIKNDGNVGIGTTSPSNKLHVQGSDSAGRMAVIENTSGTGNPEGLLVLTNQNGGGAPKFAVGTGTVGSHTKHLVVTNAGNVGIGTTNPAQEFHVNGQARIAATDGATAGDVQLYVAGSTSSGGRGVVQVDRLNDDGSLIDFLRAGAFQGNISVAAGFISYNTFTGSHLGITTESLSTGMLVELTGQNSYLGDPGNSEILYGITLCQKANSPAVLGSYLAKHDIDHQTKNIHLVASVGNGCLWVADGGQDINIGDFLISADLPGHAMKDDGKSPISYVVARAAEPVRWAEVAESTNGKRHKKISVFYTNFVTTRNYVDIANKLVEKLDADNKKLEARIKELEGKIEK